MEVQSSYLIENVNKEELISSDSESGPPTMIDEYKQYGEDVMDAKKESNSKSPIEKYFQSVVNSNKRTKKVPYKYESASLQNENISQEFDSEYLNPALMTLR